MTRSDPQAMNIGWEEASMTPTRVLSGCGHAMGSPSGVVPQSCARISAPIWPPPSRNSGQASSALPCIGLACRKLRLPAIPLVEKAEGRADNLAGTAVMAGRNLGSDHSGEFRRQGDVQGGLGGHGIRGRQKVSPM